MISFAFGICLAYLVCGLFVAGLVHQCELILDERPMILKLAALVLLVAMWPMVVKDMLHR